MTVVRAEWHLAELSADDEDPFGMMIYSDGVEIDLTSSEEELVAAMSVLWQREQRMAARGLTCEWKEAGQDCLTCPHATLDPMEGRSALCRLGKDEGTIDVRYEQMRAARGSSLEELAREVDAASEVGVLTPELEELLTQVSA